MSETGKKTTMSDIAKTLGVSKNSVSLALNGKPGVSDRLRKQIDELAHKMEYGSYNSRTYRQSKCLIIIVPHYIKNDTFFYTDVFWSIEEEAKRMNCIAITTSLSVEAEKELVLPTVPQEMHMLGYLLVGITSDAYLMKLNQSGFPVVTVDISYNNVVTNAVGSANIASGYLATKHLIDCGHTDIAFAGPIFAAQSVYERWSGFQQAMLHHGLSLNESCNILGNREHIELFDTVDVLQTYMAAIEHYPTAWFCAGDRIAIAMMTILSHKFRIPEDISIIGFDDIMISQVVKPNLTTIRVDRKLMGKLAVDRLLQLQTDGSRIISINLPGKLIIRDSVMIRSDEHA